jgi:hypothetical protein
MKASELQDHMLGSYFGLRKGMVLIAFAFPLILWIGAFLIGEGGLQGSLSAYYHTGMRNWFVGLLVAIGACLYLYKGFSTSENVSLNVAGLLVVGVAMIPTEFGCGDNCRPITAHRVVAVLFFLCIAYVAIFKGPETLSLIKDEVTRRKYRRTYRTLGTIMIVSPAVALISSLILEGPTGKKYVVVFAEALAVWIFAAYWLLKSREMAFTMAEKRALDQELQTQRSPSAQAGHRIKKLFAGQTVQPTR